MDPSWKKTKTQQKKTFWAKQNSNLFGKQCRENVVSGPPGVKPESINCDTNSVKPNSSKWIICEFPYMLYVAWINAPTVVLLNKGLSPQQKANECFKFTCEILNALVKAKFQYEIEHWNGLQAAMQQSVWDILGIRP